MEFSKNFVKAYNARYGRKPVVRVEPTHNITIADLHEAFKNKSLSDCKKHIGKTVNHEFRVYQGLSELDQVRMDELVKVQRLAKEDDCV